MKLSELTNQLQRLHDLYPHLDPEIVITEVAYKSYDKEKSEPEFYCRTLQITCYELRTLVHLPSEQLFSERGPYLNIFYEGDYIHGPEDFWKNNYFQQHANKQTGVIHPSSCTTSPPKPTVDSTTNTKSTFELATEVLEKFNEEYDCK
jgi:hypothetical protein